MASISKRKMFQSTQRCINKLPHSLKPSYYGSIITTFRRHNSDNNFDFSFLDDNTPNTSSNNSHSSRSSDFDSDFDYNNDNRRSNYNNNNNSNNRRGNRNSSFGGFNDDFDMFGQGGMKQKKKWGGSQIEWNKQTLTPFTKDFYQEHPDITNKTDLEIDEFRKTNQMIIHGNGIAKPFDTFAKSGLPEMCIEHLKKMGITDPSPIQQQGIPMALSGRDLVGISRTGSGKTLAYLLPAIVHIQSQEVVKSGEGPIGLVIAPTRELAIQIDEEIHKYIRSNPKVQLKHCAVYGGSDRHKQISSLRQSPDILVATPGRLLDLLDCGETNFLRTTYVVLDEADRMLDMGFRDDLESILSYIRPDKQTLMWSATWPKEIQQIAQGYMNNPIRVQIGSTELAANQNIEQCFRQVSDQQKMQQFLNDIEEIQSKGKKTLVFTNMKRSADMLQQKLRSMGVRGAAIHGDKSQSMRERTLKAFRENEISVLIATDVVARGIDITDITVVLNYDFPNNVEDYVHRIGRTGRAERKGLALSYVNNDDVMKNGKKLTTVLKRSKQNIPAFLQSTRMY